jgi:hypothetical protein
MISGFGDVITNAVSENVGIEQAGCPEERIRQCDMLINPQPFSGPDNGSKVISQ